MDRKPKVHKSRFVHEGFFRIREDLLEHPAGSMGSYSTMILPYDATAILAQDEKGNWILNREYRHGVGEYILGCPGGSLEEGEDPIIGAQREFFEETGYWVDEIFLTGCIYPFPANCSQKIYCFFAKNAVKRAGQKLDPMELIETELKSDAELREEIRKKEHVDGILCAALWHADHFEMEMMP